MSNAKVCPRCGGTAVRIGGSQDGKEIVAARIGTIITNDPVVIRAAVEQGAADELLDRKRMQVMAALDLGDRWKMLAEGPALFLIDSEGNPQAPEPPRYLCETCGYSTTPG